MPSGISQIASSAVRHVPILHFWDVGSPGGTFTQMSSADFADLLDWLGTEGFVPQRLSDYIRWMRGEIDLPRKSVALVFSGGLHSHYATVYPAMVARRFKFNLTVPGSFIEHEAELAPGAGAFYTTTQLASMVASGLAEAHSESYHLEWFFQGNAAAIQRLYKAAQINLKWGGIEEKVDNYFSYAPLIGTNNSLAPVVTTYAFSALSRGYREGALTPTEIKAKYLVIDHLEVVGETPTLQPTAKIYAKKHSDSSWTTLQSSWQPAWDQAYQLVTLDTPFTFRTSEIYDLKFETQSAAVACGELVTLGSTTAQANGVETKVNSNTSSGAVTNQTLGGDIYLLESLDVETYDQVRARVLDDAQRNLDFLAPYLPASQIDVGYYYPFGTIGISLETLWLPSTLRILHPLTLTFIPWLTDRWSEIDLAVGARALVPEGFPKRALTCSLAMDATRPLAELENQIGAYSGALWDSTPDWSPFSTTLGWVNEWSADYETELAKYAGAYDYISSTLVGFQTDGVSFPGADVTKLENFISARVPSPESQVPKVLIQIGDYSPQSTTMHAIFSNPAASIQAMIDLLVDHAPTAAGFALNLEGAQKTDRALANAWIGQLRQMVDAQLPGRVIVAYAPDLYADSPDDDWAGWVEYAVWGQYLDIVAVGFYAAHDWQASIEPGPTFDWTGMHSVLNYASSQIPQAKIMPGFAFYGTWRDSGPAWSAAKFAEFYSMLKVAYEHNATWTWDAAGHEWYWTSADGTAKGYLPTPRTFADYLAEWAALGYTKFFVWAIGQGDALMYPNAEEITGMAPLLKLPSGVSQSVSDLEGSSSIGQFDVEILVGAIHESPLQAAMNSQELHGRKARLKMGYAGMPASGFPTLETLEVDRVDVGEDSTSWKLRLVDTKRSVRARIFPHATEDEPTVLCGNPMDILLAIYQNELGIGQNTNVSSSDWLIYDGAGAGYLQQVNAHRFRYVMNGTLINPNRYLDVPALLSYRNGLFKNHYLEFTVTEPQDAKAWLEREIYKVLGGYAVVNAAGQLTPRFWLAPPVCSAGVSPAFSFTDRNLTKLPTVERAPIVNQLVFRLDHDGQDFGSVLFIVAGESFSRYGLQGQQVVESRGLRSARQGRMHAQLYAQKLFRRYDSVVPVWNVEAFHQALLVEVGDLVTLSHPKVIDPVTNTTGLSNVLCEVLEKHPQYDQGNAQFKLLDVRYLAGKTSHAIATGTVPLWTLASAEQKAAYMFLASDSTGLMSDGAAGNEIYG